MQVRARLRQILTIQESPRKTAIAFATGIFLGMSPLIGLHTILGFAVARIFRLNRLVTFSGLFVTNPWTIVPIYTFGTWVGTLFLGMDDSILPAFDWSSLTILNFARELKVIILPFFIGTTFIGILSAVISYFVIYKLIKLKHG